LIQCNNIGDEGARHISDALQHNSTITSIFLGVRLSHIEDSWGFWGRVWFDDWFDVDLIESLDQSITQSLNHSSITNHSHSLSFSSSLIDSLVHSLVHWFIDSLIHWFIDAGQQDWRWRSTTHQRCSSTQLHHHLHRP